MSLHDYIERIHGERCVQKLTNRLRGGDSNERGNTFESEFAVHKITSLYLAGCSFRNVAVVHQAEDYVDDLSCDYVGSPRKENYQLKDAKRVNWGEIGTSMIADDFLIQHDINVNFHQKSDSRTILIVSDESLQRSLSNRCPEEIATHTECCYFNAESFNSLLVANDEQVLPFKQLCAFPNETDKVTKVHQAMLGAWTTLKSAPTTVGAVVQAAVDGYKPGYFNLGNGMDISVAFQERLDRVSDLRYSIENGYFVYDILGMLSGSMPIDSPEFQELEMALERNTVTEWEGFVRILSRGAL